MYGSCVITGRDAAGTGRLLVCCRGAPLGWLRAIRSGAPFCRPAPAVRGDLGRYMGLDLGLAVMRGERPRPPSYMAYWLLAAVYAFGMLGAAVAAFCCRGESCQ